MTLALDAAQWRHLRLRAQGIGGPFSALSPTLAAVNSLQAQDYNAAVLGVRARSRGLMAEDVREALHAGQISWTWLMRGTLHFVATEDLPWLLPLFGPEFIRQTERRYRELGLDGLTRARATALLQQVLADGPQTRAALKARLEAEDIPAEGQASPHLLRHAALQGALVCVPLRNSRPQYRLLPPLPASDWPGVEAAVTRLARRYLRAFGPASPADLVRWSGLPARLARHGFESLTEEVTAVQAAGQPALLLGHVDRSLILPEEHSRQIHPGGGIIRPSLLVDGIVRGRWQLKRRRRGVTVLVTPFVDLPAKVLPQLEAEVADVGRYLDQSATLQMEPPAA